MKEDVLLTLKRTHRDVDFLEHKKSQSKNVILKFPQLVPSSLEAIEDKATTLKGPVHI